MAYYLGSTLVADTTGWYVPSMASRPAAPVEGQIIYNTSLRRLEAYDNGYWVTVQDTDRPFLYRTIITTSYVAGGYQNSTPWRNVNRMVHATDVCTNLGDLMPEPGAYTAGACSLTKGFIWGTSTAMPGSSTTIGGFNMATETNAGTGFGALLASRDDCGSVFKEHYFAFISGGGSGHIDVFNLTNETVYSGNQGPDCSQSGNATGISDENYGVLNVAAVGFRIGFSTTAAYTVADTAMAGGSHQKGINSKVGKGYIGNEGGYNTGYTFRRWSFATDVSMGNVNKPIGATGEENMDMGQTHNRMLGCYDGAQNNRGWKFAYSTDTGFELGAGSVRTGVGGGSSGHCYWKA